MTRTLLTAHDIESFASPDGQPLLHHELTEEFRHSLQNPSHIKVGGHEYATYNFNPRKLAEAAIPLVLFLPLENGTASKHSAHKLHALTQQISQPIITIDMPGTGQTRKASLATCIRGSLERVAEINNKILDRLDIDQADFAGDCLGGAIAAQTAIQREERSRTLITFATPGFDNTLHLGLKDQKIHAKRAKDSDAADEVARQQATTLDGSEAAQPEMASLPPIKVARVKRKLQFGRIGLALIGNNAAMQVLPEQLHPAVEWHDFVGSVDVLTSWKSHEAAYQRRQIVAPGSSRLTVIEGAGHYWQSIRPLHAGWLIEAALGTHS